MTDLNVKFEEPESYPLDIHVGDERLTVEPTVGGLTGQQLSLLSQLRAVVLCSQLAQQRELLSRQTTNGGLHGQPFVAHVDVERVGLRLLELHVEVSHRLCLRLRRFRLVTRWRSNPSRRIRWRPGCPPSYRHRLRRGSIPAGTT